MPEFLYKSALGRLLLKPLVSPGISRLAGKLLDNPLSAVLIPGFIRRNEIGLEDVKQETWTSFNDFFTRRLKDGARPVDADPAHLPAPCDGFLRAWPISEETVLPVKDVPYTVPDLIRSKKLAEQFCDGLCLVFRLTPKDYHHYVYPDDALQVLTRRIDGVFHTVQPHATEHADVYVQNTREYTLLDTDHFGRMVYMEVGALLVGRIRNRLFRRCRVRRGEEKGWFEFGGSTILLLVRPGVLELNEDIKKASAEGLETPVRLGACIGRRL